MKRIISILLVLVMTAAVLPLSIAADDSITDGALTWSYDERTKTLTVSGEGEMPDYEWIESKDWKEDNMRLPKAWTRAEHVVIEEGVTSIGAWAFMRFGSMSDISLPETLTKIGRGAFEYTYLDYIEFPKSLCELEGCFWSTVPPKIMIFKGDAPNLDNWTDFSITVTFKEGDLTTIYYPKENATWTDEVKEAFGPRIAWNDQTPPEPTAEDVFDDIKASAWYYDSVQYVYDNKFMIGTSAHTFAPNAELTRAQAMQMLFNMSGEDPEDHRGETQFDDVSENAWCAPAVKWAVENRITSGVRT
ncbi:MAG: S-layer homology domain-containing protein, partial [Clostridia bacterium]|nr:S-layer homology domain-containing protein [Clostridia bacterium]